MGRKLTLEYVRGFFEEQGCEMLDEEYKNNYTKMRYICSCGDSSEICFYNFKIGNRCKKCGIKRRVEKRRFNFKLVKKDFKDYGCELLEKVYKQFD